MQEKIVISRGDKTLILKYLELEEFDMDILTQIDYSNVLGEQLTVSVLVNKVGLLKAEQQELVRMKELDFKIFEAQLFAEKKKKFVAEGAKATIAEIEAAVLLDSKYRVKKADVINCQKNLEYVEALYIAVRDKAQKVNSIYNRVPEEHANEIIEGTINSVLIKKREALIK